MGRPDHESGKGKRVKAGCIPEREREGRSQWAQDEKVVTRAESVPRLGNQDCGESPNEDIKRRVRQVKQEGPRTCSSRVYRGEGTSARRK